MNITSWFLFFITFFRACIAPVCSLVAQWVKLTPSVKDLMRL